MPQKPQEWTWNHTGHSHDGVLIFNGKLSWYHESSNPHSCVGGTQSFQEFLEHGPMVGGLSEAQQRELYAAVRALTTDPKTPAP